MAQGDMTQAETEAIVRFLDEFVPDAALHGEHGWSEAEIDALDEGYDKLRRFLTGVWDGTG